MIGRSRPKPICAGCLDEALGFTVGAQGGADVADAEAHYLDHVRGILGSAGSVASLATQLEATRAALEAERAHCAKPTRSLSWRLTAPLRWRRSASAKSKCVTELRIGCWQNGPSVGGRFTESVVASGNLSMDHIDLYRRSIPFIAYLWGEDKDSRTERVLEMPPLFQRMIVSNPAARSALNDLWMAYIIHGEPRRAFPIEDPLCAENLLKFANSYAKSVGYCDPNVLGLHAAYFRELNE